MKKIIEYNGTNEVMQPIVAEQAAQGFTLKEVLNLTTGNFLVFDDTPPEVVRQQETAAAVEEIKATMAAIQAKLDALTGSGGGV